MLQEMTPMPHEDETEPIIQNSPTQSRYVEMLLQLDKIPKLYNLLASAFTWLLLAGYIALPGTFTSISNSRKLADGAGTAGKLLVRAVQNVPLLVVAALCCAVGAGGMLWLWWSLQGNYVWLISRIIL